MPIKVLPQEVISRIAAGEVVERPASVVKELIENSLDAGATQVSVEIHGSGLKLIRVTDNGSGIPRDEVDLAFERYATSKISKLDDLQKISTLGFRGEALPSIAAVSQVELVTRTEEDDTGTLIVVEKGVVTKRESRSHHRGTSVVVRHLFRNFPARLKFLKSPATENGHIADTVYHYAMAFPEVKFRLLIEGREVLSTTGQGGLQDVISIVYGAELAEQMMEICEAHGSISIFGFISPPSLSRSSRNYMDVFVNRRWVHNKVVARAIEEAYYGWLMSDRYPVAILNLSAPAEELDINVHPAKAEIKFRNSQAVFSLVRQSIRKKLESVSVGKSLHIQSSPLRFSSAPDNIVPSVATLRVIGQLANTYIIAEGATGLFLIDQHAAHERVLFEKIMEKHSRHSVEMQGLLEPVYVELDPKRDQLVKAHGKLLEQFGIKLEPFGTRSYLLRAIPAIMKGAHPTEMLHNVVDSLANETGTQKPEEKLALSLACHSSVKAGDTLSIEEMTGLVRQLEQTTRPQTCPHGRPTMVHLSSRELEKEFGRLT